VTRMDLRRRAKPGLGEGGEDKGVLHQASTSRAGIVAAADGALHSGGPVGGSVHSPARNRLGTGVRDDRRYFAEPGRGEKVA